MLCVIGILNFSDDYGVVRANPVFLKNQIFPYKASLRLEAFSAWLDRLVELEVLIQFTHRGESYYYIRTFRKHQKVEKPSKTRNVPERELLQILYELGYVMQEDFAFIKNTPRLLPDYSGSVLPNHSGSSRETVGELSGREGIRISKRISKGEGESRSGENRDENSELTNDFHPNPPRPAPPPFPSALFTPPSIDEVKYHFRLSGGRDEMAIAFHGKWSSLEWMDGRSYLKNWPARIPNFITNFLKNEQRKTGQSNKPSGNIVSGDKNYSDA